jgi:hypothetical protein
LAWLNAPLNTTQGLRMCGTVAKRNGIDPVELYKQHFTLVNDPYNHFYGTHDYIAHFALDYLHKYDVSGKYLWLSDLNRRDFYAYLLGTEYPDYGIAPLINLDCGRSTQIKNDFDKSESHKFKNCGNFIRKRESKVYEALQKRNKDNEPDPWHETAAFYIGAITHYIAEQSNPHHASDIGTKRYHQWIEDQVSIYTTLEAFYESGFFNVNLEKILGWSPIFDGIKSLPPYQAMNQLALISTYNKETFFNGEIENGSQSAQYFYDFYSVDCGNGYGCWNTEFEYYGRDGSNLPPNLSYLAENFVEFFDRIEELLNWAVYFTASAIKYVLKDFSGQFTPCQNTDDDNNNPQPSDDERYPPLDSFDVLTRYMGLIAAFVAVGLVGRKTFGGLVR